MPGTRDKDQTYFLLYHSTFKKSKAQYRKKKDTQTGGCCAHSGRLRNWHSATPAPDHLRGGPQTSGLSFCVLPSELWPWLW